MGAGPGRVTVVVVSFLLACGGDDDGGGGGTRADGSVVDASRGADDAGRADGGVNDAGLPGDAGALDSAPGDAASAPDAAGPGLVTVTVEWSPYPRDGATVFFLRSDDSVIDIVPTDEGGRAQAMYDEPGTVVIQMGVGIPTSQQALVAYLDVPPGTDIYSGADTIDRRGTITITGPSPDNPLSFGIETACGRVNSTTPTVTATIEFCEPQTHVVWVASGIVAGQPRAFSAYLPAIPVVEAGASAEVAGPLREDLVQTTRVTGLPEALEASLFYRLYSEHGVVQEGPQRDGLMPVDGSVEVVDPFHDMRGLGLLGRTLTSIYRLGDNDNVTDFAAWEEHDGAPNIDLAPVSPAFLDGSVFHRSSATWTWSESSPGFVTAVHGTVVVQEPAEQLYYWRLVAPDDGTPVRIPRLPPPYDRFNVDPDSNVTSSGLDLLGHTRGYAAVLADLESALWDFKGQFGDLVTKTYGFNNVIE
jgi:hypothetical protein